MHDLERVLSQFVEMYRDGERELLDFERPDALNRWRDICHSLGSACASIGATLMAAQLRDFESDLSGSQGSSDHSLRAARLNVDLIDLVGRLDRALGEWDDRSKLN